MNIHIDQELKKLIPALAPEEFSQLEANVLRDGCRDPLSVWKTDGKSVLLDGHNRYAICEKHGKKFETKVIEIEDRDHAKLWIEEYQIGRRNLSDGQFKVFVESIAERIEGIRRAEAAITAGKATSQPIGKKGVSVVHPVVGDAKPKQINTLRETAEKYGASQKGVQAVRDMKKTAVGRDLIEKVRENKMTLAQAKAQSLKDQTKQFKADRAQEERLPSLDIFNKQAASFFITIDTKLSGVIKELKDAKQIPVGLQMSAKALVQLLKKISGHAAKYAEQLENAMRR